MTNIHLLGATVVRNMESEAPDNTTLVLTWQPPDPTNGDILNYIVRITVNINGNDVIITQESVSETNYRATTFSKPSQKK